MTAPRAMRMQRIPEDKPVYSVAATNDSRFRWAVWRRKEDLAARKPPFAVSVARTREGAETAALAVEPGACRVSNDWATSWGLARCGAGQAATGGAPASLNRELADLRSSVAASVAEVEGLRHNGYTDAFAMRGGDDRYLSYTLAMFEVMSESSRAKHDALKQRVLGALASRTNASRGAA